MKRIFLGNDAPQWRCEKCMKQVYAVEVNPGPLTVDADEMYFTTAVVHRDDDSELCDV